jgi:hypothetical protein
MSPKNQEYADKHGFEYLELRENLYKYRGSYTWLKFTILEQMLEEGYIKDGDLITHLDADMCVAKTDIPYETTKSFSYSIDSGNTHCMGSFSMDWNDFCVPVNEDEIEDIDTILKYISDVEYNKLLENERKVYEEYFSLEGMFRNIVKRIK